MATELATRPAETVTVTGQTEAERAAQNRERIHNGKNSHQPQPTPRTGERGKVHAKPIAKPTAKPTTNTKPAGPPTASQVIFAQTKGFCLCGCGASTNAGRWFVQGHDARVKGWLLRVERGEMMVKDLPKLVQKMRTDGAFRTCPCCKQPVLVGKSTCDHTTCNCSERAAIVKRPRESTKRAKEMELLAGSTGAPAEEENDDE